MTEDAILLGAHDPETPVAWSHERVTTAHDFVAHVAGFVELLPEAEPEEEVVVICRDRYRFAVALIAAWQRGFVAALPPNAQLDTIRELRLRPGVRTVIHDVDGIDKGIDVRDPRVVDAAREKVGILPFRPFDRPPPERQLATVYTSGSTGEHTACPKTCHQLLGEATLLSETFSMRETPRVLAMVPAHHIYGLLFGVLTPLASGGCFHRTTPLHAGEVRAVLETGVDALVTVPAQLRGLLVAKKGELPPVPRVFSSAAPLSPNVADAIFERFGWTITEGFGSSETGGIAWRQSGGRGLWQPFEGVTVSAAEDGSMIVESPFLHPDAPRPYIAPDRVKVSADGHFEHRGRADGVLKIGGVRVSLAEVENRLRSIVGVSDAAVLSQKVDGPRGHEIWAVVAGADLEATAIRAGLRGWLSPLAMPRRLRIVEKLPRLGAGKIRRRDLVAMFDEPPSHPPTRCAPTHCAPTFTRGEASDD